MTKPRVTDVKDDPKFPVKPVVGGLTAVIAWVVTSNVIDNNTVNGILTVLLGMLGVFVAKNPKVRK